MDKRQFHNIIYYTILSVITAGFAGFIILTQHSLTASDAETTLYKDGKLLAFSDVPMSHQASKAIYTLAKDNVISGYADDTFRPDQVVNRAEALKYLFEISPVEKADVFPMYNTYIENTSRPKTMFFSDVNSNEWFAPYLLKAHRLGIIQGNERGKFDPGGAITLDQFLKMVLILEREQIVKEDDKEIPFPSVKPYQWYTSYFVRAKKLGLLPLYEDEEDVEPWEELTRARMAQLIYKYRSLRTQPAGSVNTGGTEFPSSEGQYLDY